MVRISRRKFLVLSFSFATAAALRSAPRLTSAIGRAPQMAQMRHNYGGGAYGQGAYGRARETVSVPEFLE